MLPSTSILGFLRSPIVRQAGDDERSMAMSEIGGKVAFLQGIAESGNALFHGALLCSSMRFGRYPATQMDVAWSQS